MNKLPVAGILILMLLVVSGYVSSEPTDLADQVQNEGPVVSADPHVNYYEQYLIASGLSQPGR